MQDLIVSLNGNVLKTTTLKNGTLNAVVKEVPSDVAVDSKIVDVSKFSEVLGDVINELSVSSKGKYRLNFVIEPEDMHFKFITVNKNEEGLESKVITEIQSKLDGVALGDLYFSYVKIAPFVYQFIGVNKELFEKYLQVASNLRLELHSVLPWVLLLPKYVSTNSSSIFVCSVGNNPVVVISELGGVFFVGSYDENEDPAKLYSLVQELSVYKRQKPIDKVYTFNYPFLKETKDFKVHKVELPNLDSQSSAGFETNILANYMLDLAPDTISSQTNLLNLLPVPVVEKKQLSLALIAVPVSALLIAAVLFGGFMFFGKNKGGSTNLNSGQVLSNSSSPQTSETTQSTQSLPAPKAELSRKELVIRVENGSGVAGIAAQTKELLENLGYKVISIDTADTTIDSTLFKFKDAKVEFKDMLSADLKSKFPSVVIEQGIDTAKEYDVLIVVGTTQKF